MRTGLAWTEFRGRALPSPRQPPRSRQMHDVKRSAGRSARRIPGGWPPFEYRRAGGGVVLGRALLRTLPGPEPE